MKPTVYIASPYTKGDPALNTRFQCKMFDKLLKEGAIYPVVPLWSHFQHLLFPRSYEDWMRYDFETIERCDACLRLDAELPEFKYCIKESFGADREVKRFKELGKPVFYSIKELYLWIMG